MTSRPFRFVPLRNNKGCKSSWQPLGLKAFIGAEAAVQDLKEERKISLQPLGTVWERYNHFMTGIIADVIITFNGLPKMG